MADRYGRFSSWYRSDAAQPSAAVDYTVEQAFVEALRCYTQELAKNSNEAKALDEIQASSMSDVIAAVDKARKCYEKKRTASRTRKCLVEISTRLVYYGNIMDVMVQQSPEYVSLAWGTMKLLFGVIVENEKLGAAVVTGLCDVADALPRTELFLELYPTEAMKAAVTMTYNWILRFLTRALKWYREGRLRHALTAVVSPAALQYDDILSGIRHACDLLSNHASANSFAEQRDMHERLRGLQDGEAVAFSSIQAQQTETQVTVSSFRDLALSALSNVEKRQHQASKDIASLALLVQQMQEHMISNQAVNADTQLHLRNQMSEIQLTQALAFVSSSVGLDHMAILQQLTLLRDRRRVPWREYATGLQTSPAFSKWNTSPATGIIDLRSTFKDRNILSGSVTAIVQQLRQHRIAVLWALKSQTQAYDTTEILKSMIHQALTLDFISHTDVAFAFELRQYLDARSDEDYVNLLGELLSHFKLVYILVQVEAMLSDGSSRFRRYLNTLIEEFEKRAPGQMLKILISSSGPLASSQQPSHGQVLRVGGKKKKKCRKYGVSLQLIRS